MVLPSSSPPAPPVHTNDAGGAGAPGAVTPELVNAMVPAQILHEDEIVLLLTKPSLFWLLYSSFPFLLVTSLLGILAAQVSLSLAGITPSSVVLVAVLVCLGRLIWALLVWTSHIYMLTNSRILTIKGVINVHMFQAHLRKIQNLRVYKPLGQRVFGTGTLGFATAGAAGEAESTWVMIHRPLEVQEQVVAAMNKAK
jgi:uncharacterized membrane protein YdbT with pleckstrin-like domain